MSRTIDIEDLKKKAETRVDSLMLEAFGTNHPSMKDYALMKMELIDRAANAALEEAAQTVEKLIDGNPFDAHVYKVAIKAIRALRKEI